MPEIKTIYFINHNHTDIGYTDHQDIVFQKHMEFIDEAIDVCEATADFHPDARFRWTCEATGITERYLNQASQAQIDRFVALHRQGRMDVTGMCYNFISPIAPEVLLRSLYPVRRLRDRYGLSIEAAMQCDVNGISWMFADLLPTVGVDFLAMGINPTRGGTPLPRPGVFWWEGPSGKRIGVWNGYTYGWSLTFWGMGDLDRFSRAMPQWIAELEARTDYPYDFLFLQVTHPQGVDNGPPYRVLSEFARDWNAAGNSPRLVFTTLAEFGRSMVSEHMQDAPVFSGDWVDWWSDGVGTSAHETAVYRRASELLPSVETLDVWLQAQGRDRVEPDVLDTAYENAILYAEHSWGSSGSLREPTSFSTRAQWNRKASYAYIAAAFADEGRDRAASALAPLFAPPGDDLLVLNTLPWPRRIEVRLPDPAKEWPRFAVDESQRPKADEAERRPAIGAIVDVPAMGFATAPVATLDDSVASDDGLTLENEWYRIEMDPATGGLASWYDKDRQSELAAADGPWSFAQYIYETVDSPSGRAAIFDRDLTRLDHGIAHRNTPWYRRGAESVRILGPRNGGSQAGLAADISAPGCRSIRVAYSLPSHRKSLSVRYRLDKIHVIDPESVYFPFQFALGAPRFILDLDGVPTVPEDEQLPGSSRDWYSVGRWGAVSDRKTTVTVVPLDAPLTQVGGITTGHWAGRLQPEAPALVSWALNNHWHTNFKARQGGEMMFRYVLTSREGDHDPVASSRFAAETVTPPVVVPGRGASDRDSRSFATLAPAGAGLLWFKPSEDGRGVIARGQNPSGESVRYTLSLLAAQVESACLTSPIEVDGQELTVTSNQSVEFTVAPRSIQSIRLRLRPTA
ncbi:MAG: hypothetical protein OXG11_05590 [Chloroflexi bacterium]|nr:hypothetical protein [Chloroflexota bacterium]